MVFENLRKNKFDETKKEVCMNCGSEINPEERNIYTRRFCSSECRDSYMKPRGQDN